MGKGAYGQVLGDDVLRSGHLQALGDMERDCVCHSCSGLWNRWTVTPFHRMSWGCGEEDDGRWQIHLEALWVKDAYRKRHAGILRTFQLSKKIPCFLLWPAPEGSLCLTSICIPLHASLSCCSKLILQVCCAHSQLCTFASTLLSVQTDLPDLMSLELSLTGSKRGPITMA